MWRRGTLVSAAAMLVLTASVAEAQRMATSVKPADLPPAVRALQQGGLVVVSGDLPAPKGMKGWAAYKGQQPIALYSSDDGKQVIIGSMFDAAGYDVTRDPLERAVGPAISGVLWGQLQQSNWIRDGSPNAKRVVYVFSDPNCPYCTRLWSDMRPWVKSGKVQVRHIMVGILTPTSLGKAAAILASKDPSEALNQHEVAQTSAGGFLTSMHVKLPDNLGVQPLTTIPDKVKAKLIANEQLMASLDANATPAIYWQGENGEIRSTLGANPALLPSIMGSK
ncbi:thiol:disulfide interchange protein DsbG [Pandoraea terrae]